MQQNARQHNKESKRQKISTTQGISQIHPKPLLPHRLEVESALGGAISSVVGTCGQGQLWCGDCDRDVCMRHETHKKNQKEREKEE
jgi:hypothetical protein